MSSPADHTPVTISPDPSPDVVGTEAALARVPRDKHPRTTGRRKKHYETLVGNCGRHDPHAGEIQGILNAVTDDTSLKITHGTTDSDVYVTRAANGLLEDYEYAPDCSFLDDAEDGWFRMVYRSQALYEFWLYKALDGIGEYTYEFVESDGFSPVVSTSTIGRYVTGDDPDSMWRCKKCGETFDESVPHTTHCWDVHETARDPRELREKCIKSSDPDDVSQTQLNGY